jgi:hypothetical protein
VGQLQLVGSSVGQTRGSPPRGGYSISMTSLGQQQASSSTTGPAVQQRAVQPAVQPAVQQCQGPERMCCSDTTHFLPHVGTAARLLHKSSTGGLLGRLDLSRALAQP